ncbi:hypothetical protein, partial [Streptomyces longispororuber]|uniref:hypothetical protein n=1 Tax=Streptomyces longispororuber TaxID=68230 RepID=UPI00210EC22C
MTDHHPTSHDATSCAADACAPVAPRAPLPCARRRWCAAGDCGVAATRGPVRPPPPCLRHRPARRGGLVVAGPYDTQVPDST